MSVRFGISDNLALSPLGRGLGEGGKRMRGYARALRQNFTDAEMRLWQRLRGRRFERIKFKRQQPIAGYIVDFIAPDLKLIIEIDGGQHAERAVQDAERTAALEVCGYHVVRFWNNDVMGNIDGVLEALVQELHIVR